MKDYRFFRGTTLLVVLIPVFSFLFGCTAHVSQPVDSTYISSGGYRSELSDPDAKALQGFSEFRLLAAEGRWDDAMTALKRASQFDPQSDYLQLALAEVYLHRQQPELAITILQKMEDRTPDSVAVQQLYGDVLSFQKKHLLALEHFERALQIDPDNTDVQLRFALALARLERGDEAIAVLEKLLKQHPDAGVAKLSLARLYLLSGRPEQAATTYKALIEEQPAAYQPVLEYGKMVESTDVNAAIDVYQNFLQKNPRAAVIRQQLAQVYLTHNRMADALVQLQLLRQQYPENPRIAGQVGLVQLDLENWAAAEKEFRWLVDYPEREQKDYFYLAMALSQQQKYKEAISVLEESLGGMADYPEGALQLAYLYQKTGQDERAIGFLKKMIAEDVHPPDLYYYLVAFLGDRKEYQQALEYALQGVDENPTHTRLLYQLGVLYEKMSQRQKAIETMEKVLQVDENHADALNFLAYDQAVSGKNLPEALERAQRAVKIMPSGFIVDTLGWVLYKMKRYDESRVQLEKAVEMHPDDPVITEHLGDLYRAMKLNDKAAATYRRVLEINPQAQQVQEKLNKLVEEMS